MSNNRLSSDKGQNLRAAYDQVCNGYHAADDFRATLLGLLPLASGASILLVLSNALTQGGQPAVPLPLLLPIGTFGFAITLGLYFYELRGIQYCTHLIEAGKALERQLKVAGKFFTRPKRRIAGYISEVSATNLIYAAVLAWIFVAAVIAYPKPKVDDPAILLASVLALSVLATVMVFARRVKLHPDGEPTGKAADRSKTNAAALSQEGL